MAHVCDLGEVTPRGREGPSQGIVEEGPEGIESKEESQIIEVISAHLTPTSFQGCRPDDNEMTRKRGKDWEDARTIPRG